MRDFSARLKTSQRIFIGKCRTPFARLLFCLGLLAQVLLLTGCSSTADQQLFADKCANGNLNCKNAALLLATTGAKVDLSPQAVQTGTDLESVPIKPVRYNDTTSLSFVVQNTSLLPLRSFSLDRSLTTGFTVESSGDHDCAAISVLLYNQTCRVTISFTPGTVAPDIDLTFNFKTLLGDTVIFTSGVYGAKITSDFSLSGSTSFATELVHDPADSSYVTSDLTIANYGNIETLKSISFTLNGPHASSFTIAPSGGGSDCTSGQDLLPNGGTCVIHIRYRPLTSGYHYADLNLVTTSGQVRSFAISGHALSLSPTPSALSFGSHLVSSAIADLTVTLTNPNTNASPAASTCSYAVSGSAQYSIQANTCAASISAAASCTITIRYTPTASASWHGGSLDVACNARGGSLVIPLSAESVTSPLRADVSRIDFGKVPTGGTASGVVTLSNLGGSTLNSLSPLVTSLTGSGVSISSTTCTSTLAASASCTITVSYSPTVSGSNLSMLSVGSDGGSLENAIVLQGNAETLQTNRTTMDFGSVIVNEDRMGAQIIVLNPSSSNTFTGCSLDSSALAAQGFTLDSGSTCTSTTTLVPGASCILNSGFTATGTPGSRAAAAVFSCTVGGSRTLSFTAQVVSDLSLVVLPPTTTEFAGR